MKKRKFCGGFTLLEVLVVVIISIVVVMFAAPAYKKTQERNRFLAAEGVLVELANGIRMVQAEYPGISKSADVSNGDNSTVSPYDTTNIVHWMMTNKYMSKIDFTSGSTYLGYKFKVSTTGAASCSGCSGNGVACMYESGVTNVFTEYRCVYIDSNGDIHLKS